MTIKYGSNTNSEDINKDILDKYDFIKNTTKSINKIESDMKEQKVIQNVQAEFLKRRIIELESKNNQLNTSLYNTNRFNKKLTIQPYEFKTEDSNAYIDKTFNIATFNSNNTTPISYVNTSEGAFIPNELKIEIKDKFDVIHYIENERKNMIDGDPLSYWHREYHFNVNSNVKEIVLDVTIDMPYSSVNNYLFNNIQLKPYPFKNIDVIKIEVLSKDKWNNVSSDDLKSNNLYIQCDEEPIEKIRFTLRQDQYVIINGEKIFYLGLHNLLVSQVRSSSDKVEFYYDIDSNKNMIINDIEPVFKNNTKLNLHNNFEYELCSLSPDGYTTQIDKTYPIYLYSSQKTRLIIKLSKENVIPVLDEIIIKYSQND